MMLNSMKSYAYIYRGGVWEKNKRLVQKQKKKPVEVTLLSTPLIRPMADGGKCFCQMIKWIMWLLKDVDQLWNWQIQ